MSLFKLRDLWATKCGREEVFDQNSLLVTNVHGEKQEFILVGSHSGCLRVYSPQLDLEAGEYGNFKAIDLLIEVQLEQPILQLTVGKFVSGSKIDYLAILHPKSLAIYNLITFTGSTEHGDQWEVSLVYEHNLERRAYGMVSGGFGGVEGRDFICVQALDGRLSFFEQETLSANTQLPEFLLPAPFAYIPHTDSFLFLSADWHLQSFRYQALAEESSTSLLPSWSFNLGEEMLEMHYISVTSNQAGIFLLTHHNFFCFTETGSILFSKRLQYVPVCSHVYSRGEPTVMSMVVSESNDLLIYEDSKLVWAAQLHLSPIAVHRISLQVLSGCVVVLTEEGELECCYLGSEPTLFVPPPLPSSITVDSQLEDKLAKLQHQVATYSSSHKESLGAPGEKRELKVTGKIWDVTDGSMLEVSLEASSALHSVNIAIDCASPLIVSPQTHFIQNITDRIEVSSRVSLGKEGGLPWDLTCTIVCVYFCGEVSGVSSTEIQLPLRIVLEPAPPLRGLEYGFNFTASQVVTLPSLFTDLNSDTWKASGSSDHLAGFRYKGREELGFTIAMNRPGLKYRLEGDALVGLTLPVCLLARKLSGKHLCCTQYSIPLSNLFAAVDQNLFLRGTIRRVSEELRVGSGQMRACQRRLLTKMRDKTPSDLQPLTSLIDYTHKLVMEAAHEMEAAQRDLEENSYLLKNLIRLTISLVKLAGTAIDDEAENLYEAMAFTHHFSEDQGWAEITQAALANLLKTTLARSMRDQFGGEPEESVVTDALRLKKRIATAIDRVVKGQRRISDRGVSPIPEGEDEEGRQVERHTELESEELKKIIEEAELNLNHL